MKHVDYATLTSPRFLTTRSSSSTECVCSVCITGRKSGKEYTKYRKETTDPVGAPKTTSEVVKASPLTVCSVCLCEYGQGLSHTCSKTSTRYNATNLVRNLSEKSQANVVGKVLAGIYKDRGLSTSGETTKLESGGTPTTVTLGKVPEKPSKPTFTFESICALQKKQNLTDKETLEVAKFLRYQTNKSSVESNLKRKIID